MLGTKPQVPQTFSLAQIMSCKKKSFYIYLKVDIVSCFHMGKLNSIS